jgi:hypothetical protein
MRRGRGWRGRRPLPAAMNRSRKRTRSPVAGFGVAYLCAGRSGCNIRPAAPIRGSNGLTCGPGIKIHTKPLGGIWQMRQPTSMTSLKNLRVTSAEELDARLTELERPDAPAIFLSGSVPSQGPLRLDPSKPQIGAPADEVASTREAVVALARAVPRRGARLVLGAHPSIVPIVGMAQRDCSPVPDSVLLFQSELCEPSTAELWDLHPVASVLIWTPIAASPSLINTRK